MSIQPFPVALNFLLIVGDDIGIEQLGRFARGGVAPGLPPAAQATLDAFYDGSVGVPTVRFGRNYACQLCSPTRAAIQTSRWGCDTGIGTLLRDDNGIPGTFVGLQRNEITLAHAIKAMGQGHNCLFAGKWHLAAAAEGGPRHPLLMGYDHYIGIDRNIQSPSNYRNYPLVIDGHTDNGSWFHTTALTNQTMSWIRRQGSNPWFAQLAYFAAHTPNIGAKGTPPADLYDTGLWGAPPITNQQFGFKAHIEAMSRELGRLLAMIDYTNTIVCFVTDNGSGDTNLAAEYMLINGVPTQWDGTHGKDSPYEGGICVPMMWRGPGITGVSRTSNEITHVVDIMPTALELMGGTMIPGPVYRGVSLAPLLRGEAQVPHPIAVYSEGWQPLERNAPNRGTIPGDRAIVGKRYKIIRRATTADDPVFETYDLMPDGVTYNPMETTNLTPGGSLAGLNTQQRAAVAELEAFQADVLASVEL